MKRFSCIILILITVFTCASCGTLSTDKSTSQPSTSDKATSNTDITEKTKTASNSEYEALINCCSMMNTGENLIVTTVKLQISMWNIMKKSDEDDIKDAFSSGLKMADCEPTMISSRDLVVSFFEKYSNNNSDSAALELANSCVEAYKNLHNMVLNAEGTFADFNSNYDELLEKYTTAYAELEKYLSNKGITLKE